MPVTVPCERCGRPVTRSPSLMKAHVYCSRQCAGVGRTKTEPTARRNLWRPGHVLAGVNGYVAEHRAVLFDKIGYGPHLCHWCGKGIRWTSRLVGTGHDGMLVADHVNVDGFDNRPENLVPSCQGCNATRARWIRDDEDAVIRADGTRIRAERHVCHVCRSEFVRAPRRNRANLYCSRACFYAARRVK